MIQEGIARVVEGESLSLEEAAQVMDEIMGGEATPSQFGAFVTALRLKGETPDEIAGMARVMREKALRVSAQGSLVDTCGTGGDGSGAFNVSTTAAFVAAGAGARVAKHGNRAMSGACGSADVLEAVGVKIDLSPESVARCLDEVGFGFMFAQRYHPSMRFAAGPRREIGIRTVFNILGPLTNPAGATRHLLGVADPSVGENMARVLGRLGSERALVVYGLDGMDEITLSDETQVWELRDGSVSSYRVTPGGVRAAALGQRGHRGGQRRGERGGAARSAGRRGRPRAKHSSGERWRGAARGRLGGHADGRRGAGGGVRGQRRGAAGTGRPGRVEQLP